MDGWMDKGWKDGWMMDDRMLDGWMEDGRMLEGWMDDRMDGWIER